MRPAQSSFTAVGLHLTALYGPDGKVLPCKLEDAETEGLSHPACDKVLVCYTSYILTQHTAYITS